MAQKRHNDIHRQQLFHWVGSHIEDKKTNKLLTDALRREYVDDLQKTLKTGLWMTVPRTEDRLTTQSKIKVVRPITCFTEWSLKESLPHTMNYGRLGFGFPKRFVLELGGQPVTYLHATTKPSLYVAALEKLIEFAKKDDTEDDTGEASRCIAYLSHFAKRARDGKGTLEAKTKSESETPEQKATDKKATPPATKSGDGKENRQRKIEKDPYGHDFGNTFQFLEEREWRIVYDDRSKHGFKDDGPNPNKKFIPFTPGDDLFTVVLPDTETFRIAMEREELREALFPKGKPQVNVLSFNDIGTF